MQKHTNLLKSGLALVYSRDEATPVPRKPCGAISQTADAAKDVPNLGTFMPHDLRESISNSFFHRRESVCRVAAKNRVGRNAVEDVVRSTLFERDRLWQLRYQRLWERYNGSLPPAPAPAAVPMKRAA